MRKTTKSLVTIIFCLTACTVFKHASAQNWSLNGNNATNPNTMFVGTTDQNPLSFRTQNLVRMRISVSGLVGIGTLTPVFALDNKSGSYNTDSLYRIRGFRVFSLGGGFISSNIATGFNALLSNTTGSMNTATGSEALLSNTTGNLNAATGALALRANTSGVGNAAFGSSALRFNTSGSGNVAIGNSAMYRNVTRSKLVAIGDSALYNNEFGATLPDHGTNNIAIGHKALFSNTIGYHNIALGNLALEKNTSGYANIAIGLTSLANNTTGFENTAVGNGALKNNTTGQSSIAFGNDALLNNSTGNGNSAFGLFSMTSVTTGNWNTGLGLLANVAVGTISNSTAVGYNAIVDVSNKVRIGNASILSNGGQVSWTAYSDARIKNQVRENVPGLEFIQLLRPVTYHFDVKKQNELMGITDTVQWDGKYDIEKIPFSGFIAQDVDAAAQKIGFEFSGVDKSGNLLGLRYSEFVVPIVKAIQEQQDLIDKQQKQIDDLIAALEEKNLAGAVKPGTTDDQFKTILGQNIPNPADNSTIIPFSIPSNCKSASILITEHTTGRVVKAIPLNCKETHLMLDAALLSAGTYTYSLYVDGNSIDTKQMVIVK